MSSGGVTFETRKEVDFVIIGSGAAGGVLAKELSVKGIRRCRVGAGSIPALI